MELKFGIGYDVNLRSNSGSSWGLITSDHYDFYASSLAFKH
jgi:hypothetical protein